jgi:hypothetical protein
MVRYKMVGRDVNSSPVQYRTWVVSDAPDLTGAQYTGPKSGPNPLVNIVSYAIFDDTAIVDFSLPLPTSWDPAYQTLPQEVSDSQLAIIDGYAYLFGSNISANIFRASLNNPANWIDTGATLPGLLYGSQLAIVDGYLYLFGGNNGQGPTDVIYSASVSDPLTWTNDGYLLPRPLQNSAFGMLDGYMYLFGGQDGYGPTSSIFLAPEGNPLVWIDSTLHLPTPLYGSQLAQVNNAWYLYGGLIAPNTPIATIWTAPLSDPYYWTFDGYLPHPTAFGQFFTVGSSGYLIAPVVGAQPTGFTPIIQCDLGGPAQWFDTMATVSGVLSSFQVAIIVDRVWLLGGNGASTIFVCQQQVKSDLTNPAVLSYGEITRIIVPQTDNVDAPLQALGFPIWKTDYNS